MDQPEFVELLGAVFEQTPHIAQQVWCDRPFADVSDLHQKMIDIVEKMPLSEKIRLIQAHPELGSRTSMAEASVQEQASVGLSQTSQPEFERLDRLNTRYREKFGFPFVMAVKGQTRDRILAEFENRLNNSSAQEIAKALSEIYKIARFRLNDHVFCS